MRPFPVLLGILAVLTAARLFAIGNVELSPDEAYYYLWAEHPDWSYYSKGPGVAFAIKFGTTLFGMTEFGVRFLSPFLALGTSLLLYVFGKRMHSEAVGFWTVLVLNATPIFNVGSLVMTIDPLSIFFWAAAMIAFWRATEDGESRTGWWMLAGLLTGLGFLCKYTNAMLFVSVLIYLAISRRQRLQFKRPGFYLSVLAFAVCLIPPLIWNANHAWITVSHLVSRGKLNESTGIHPGELLEFFAMHLGVYSPLLFLGLAAGLIWGWKPARLNPKMRFLLCLSLPLIVMYFGLSLKEAGEANWTAPAFLSGGILAVWMWMERAKSHRGYGIYAVSSVTLGIVLSLLVINLDILRAAGIPLPYKTDPGTRLRGWRSTAEAVQEVRNEVEKQLNEEVFLIADSYQTAAILAFYLPERRVEGPGHPPVYIPESQHIQNQFSFWPRYDGYEDGPAPQPGEAYFTEQKGVNKFLGRTALYITDRPEGNPAGSLKRAFGDWELLSLIEIRRRDLPLRTIRIFACYNYESLPL
jgi:hypothetical protein